MAGVYYNMQDISLIYYTANKISGHFKHNTRRELSISAPGLPIVVVYQGEENKQEWMDWGFKDVIISPFRGARSHLNIYRQALTGAKLAQTRYVALVEDDVLYSPEHFKHRSEPGVFDYNMSAWALFTWVKPPIFNYKGRANLSGLICERELFIEALEERFASYPDDSKTPISSWAEPGRYEDNLKVTERKRAEFYTNIPNVVFSHETALAFENLGTKKRMGNLRVTGLPYWESAEEVMKLYEDI